MFVTLPCPTCSEGSITVRIADPANPTDYTDYAHDRFGGGPRCETAYANGWHDEAIVAAVEAATARLAVVETEPFAVYADR